MRDSLQGQVDRLREHLNDRARDARAEHQKSSTLPLEAFDIADPMLEAALTDSAMEFFLKHMTAHDTEAALPTDAAGKTPIRGESPSDADLRQTEALLSALGNARAPDLLADLDDERFWILIDLLINGDHLSRHRATVELREVVGRIQAGGYRPDVLRRIVDGIARVATPSVLLQLLSHCAAARLQIIAASTTPTPV